MNSAPHLRLEDRPEFERVLDEALRTARARPGPDAAGQRPTTEELRAMALGSATAIAARAAAEYGHFVRLRDELRRPGRAPSAQDPAPSGSSGSAGAGLLPTLSVLAPLLAGTASVVFLLVGHALSVMTPEPSIAAPMRDAGRAFAALAAAALLAACAGLLVTALRHGSGAIRADGRGGKEGRNRKDGRSGEEGKEGGDAQEGLAEEVARARADWRAALLERGVLPFLREALDDPAGRSASGAPGAANAPRPPRESRHPRLGYTHPGFSSPDFGGPEHAPD
ncbi:hypothetical protein [Streptomyces glaucosporus]